MSVKEKSKQVLSMLKQIDKYKKLSKRECDIISKLVGVLMEAPANIREKFYEDVRLLIVDISEKIINNRNHDEEMDQLEETLGLKEKIYN